MYSLPITVSNAQKTVTSTLRFGMLIDHALTDSLECLCIYVLYTFLVFPTYVFYSHRSTFRQLGFYLIVAFIC